MSSSDVYPTGKCFDDALDLMAATLKSCRDPRRRASLFLVHALCKAPDETLFAHAWLEEQGRVIFVGIQDGKRKVFIAERGEYRRSWQVQESVRYTFDQALALNHQTGNYGPWVERYRQLCGGRKIWRPEEATHHV
jgi:hypothetical protein